MTLVLQESQKYIVWTQGSLILIDYYDASFFQKPTMQEFFFSHDLEKLQSDFFAT
jgi:hypothetical protein